MPYDVLDPTLAEPAPITNAGAPLIDVGETLLTMEEEIILQLGNRPDVQAGGQYETYLPRWINRGYRYVAGMLDIKELWGCVQFTLLADQHFYAVPDSLMWIKRLMLQDTIDYFDDGGIELEMIDEQTYRTLPDSSEVQTDGAALPPKNYFRYGRMLVLWPTPIQEYVAPADFRVRPADMTDPDHSPMLPQEFHEVIMLAGLSRAQSGLGMRAKAAETQNLALSLLRPIMNTDAEERSAMHMVAQPIRRRSQLYRSRGEL